jgi:hypothetical protein
MLDAAYIAEASGLGFATDSDELYHINDSGDLGRFYVTSRDGGGTRVVTIQGFDPVDVEDMAVGPCGEATCVVIADVGDNLARRTETELVVIDEELPFSATVTPLARVRMRYADGPVDAEAVALHPNGDLFILTKTADYTRLEVEPSILYRLPYAEWSGAGPGVRTADRWGVLDLSAIASDRFAGSLPTAMDISADGQRLLVLTYLNAFEFYTDIGTSPLMPTSEMIAGVDYQEIAIRLLEQQESVAYLPSGWGFLYTTESASPQGGPIIRVVCQN